MIKTIIKGTALSSLIFFSISFLTVLFQINSPLNRIDENYELRIGFPFEYYYEFFIDCPIPNSGWNIKNLILNIGLTWTVTMGIILILRKRKHNNVYN
ncbi:hypothetical protein LNJ03_12110 [Tenacibaculum dicentrarchi]|nr:hypothetical protein [Tenacibaculum dicentrarchi]